MTSPSADLYRLRALVDLNPHDNDALDALIRAHRQRGELQEAAMLGDAVSICELARTQPHWLECAFGHYAHASGAPLPYLPTLIPGRANFHARSADLLAAQYPAWIMAAPSRARWVLMCVAYGLAQRDRLQPTSTGPRVAVDVDYRVDTGLPWAEQEAFARADCRFYGAGRGQRHDISLEARAPTPRLARLRLAQRILERLHLATAGFRPVTPTLYGANP